MKEISSVLTKRDRARIVGGMETLGQLLQGWRLNARLSQTGAARQCNLASPQHWHALENDLHHSPADETLQKLSDGTGLAIETLLVASAHSRRVKMNRAQTVPA